MPTRRAGLLFLVAILLYGLANQTQVGWIYIISDGLVGVILAAYLYSWWGLNSLQITRQFKKPSAESSIEPTNSSFFQPDKAITFHEDDPIEISLQYTQMGLRPLYFLQGDEICPFTPLDAQNQSLFISALYRRQTISLSYQTSCYQRGLYTLDNLTIKSAGPFGLIQRKRTLPIKQSLLIYPAYYPLKRFRALERQAFAERQQTKAGTGTEIIALRDYRPGDMVRQIHWRTTARVGQLIVKEMSTDTDLSLTVMLDLSQSGNVGSGKYSTFETAVRITASLGYYADQHRIPFYLVGDSPLWRPPKTALSWWGILNYLAKAQNDGKRSLSGLLASLNPTSFVVVLITQSDYQEAINGLHRLARRNITIIAIIVTLDDTTAPSITNVGNHQLTLHMVTPYNWQQQLQRL